MKGHTLLQRSQKRSLKVNIPHRTQASQAPEHNRHVNVQLSGQLRKALYMSNKLIEGLRDVIDFLI